MGNKRENNRVILQTDAIQGNYPSEAQISTLDATLRRKVEEEESKKLLRQQYRKAHALEFRVMAMTDDEIDKAILLESQQPTQITADTRTAEQQAAGRKAFKQKEQEQKAVEALDKTDAIMSSSTDYIPLIGSLLRAGQYNFARDHLGYQYASNRYGLSPVISSTLDVATLPLGVSAKALAASYAGGMAGKYVGDKYFDNPHLGQFVGTLIGHPIYANASKVAQKADTAYKGYQLGKKLNKGVKDTQLITIPVEHVSPNGMTKGSALDVGEEGIHLSPVGSSTTTNIQQKTGYPFVRTGTWTFSNNTKPVEVQDVGYFGKGFNADFDNKVSNGVTNFKYTNNFEGKGNTSYLTTEPSFGLQLSKNRKIAEDDRYLSQSAEVVPEGLRLPDGTYTPKKEDANKMFADLKEYFQDWEVRSDPSSSYQQIVFNQNGVEFPVKRFLKQPDVWHVWNPQNGEVRSFDPKDGYVNTLNSAKSYTLKLRNDLIGELDYPGQLMVKRSKIAPEKSKAVDDDIDVGGTEVGDYMMKSLQNDIDEIYLSPEYIDRFMSRIPGDHSRIDVIQQIKQDLQGIKDKTKPVLFKGSPANRGTSWGSQDSGETQFFVAINPYQTIPNLKWWDSTLFHEFGHSIYRSDTSIAKNIIEANEDLTKNIKNHIIFTPKNEGDAQFLEYISGPNEFRQRIMEVVRYGIRESLTPEELYNSPIMNKVKLGKYFDKDYLVKMFKYMLATTPLITKNTDDDRSS